MSENNKLLDLQTPDNSVVTLIDYQPQMFFGVYHSQTGTTHKLAQTVEDGAKKAGAETRLLRVGETAPDEVWGNNPKWKQHLE